MVLNFLISALGKLEQDPVWDTAVRDTLGNTVPKTALTRTKAERMDVAVSQIGNTVAFVGGGLSVDKALQFLFSGVQKAGKEASNPYRWAVMARSLGVYSTMASTMWAMPFIRNYITTKRSGTVNYSDMIKSGGAPKGPPTPQQQAAVDASLKDNKKKALTILGAGAAGVVAPAMVGRILASSKKEVGKGFLDAVWKHKFSQQFMLEGGKFSKMGGLPSLLFWGVPAYIGWYHASRDPYEKKEVFVRCANFLACFSLPPALVKKIFHSKFTKKFGELKDNISFTNIKNTYAEGSAKRLSAQKMLMKQNALGMVSSIILLGVSPQVLNIFLTNRRMSQEALKKEELKKQQALKQNETGNQTELPTPWLNQSSPLVDASPQNGWPNPSALSLNSMAFYPSVGASDLPLSGYPSPAQPTVLTPAGANARQNRYGSAFPAAGLGSRSVFG